MNHETKIRERVEATGRIYSEWLQEEATFESAELIFNVKPQKRTKKQPLSSQQSLL